MLTKKVSCLFSFSLWKGCLSITSVLRTYFYRPPTINFNQLAAVPSVSDPQEGRDRGNKFSFPFPFLKICFWKRLERKKRNESKRNRNVPEPSKIFGTTKLFPLSLHDSCYVATWLPLF